MTALIDLERRGPILLIGLNRPEKRNALNQKMLRELSAAYAALCDEPDLRCGVLHSTADLFSAGLDLVDMAPMLTAESDEAAPVLTAEDEVDPFGGASASGRVGRPRTKPIVTAVEGRCHTAGLELALATDIVVAGGDAIFAQDEVRHGLMPLGGAVERFVRRCGWGEAMRWLLTGEAFSAAEALRIGVAQEVTPAGSALARALEIAGAVAAAAPAGIRGVLENAALAELTAAAAHLRPYGRAHISRSQDLQEGLMARFEKRAPVFTGA